MVQDLGYLKESASQTAGPYVHIGLTPNFESHRAEGVRHYVGFDGKAGAYDPPIATSRTPSDLVNY